MTKIHKNIKMTKIHKNIKMTKYIKHKNDKNT